MERLIDLDSSFLTYIVKKGGNYGRFQIESVCTIQSNYCMERYYLLHPVLAGNVYGIGQLIKEPAYRFQAIFSKERFKIFRTYLDTGRCDDSSDLIDSTFTGIELDEHRREMGVLESKRDVICFARGKGRIVGLVSFERGPRHAREQVGIEFPVRHINTDPLRDKFQIETGTIAIPERLNSRGEVIDQLAICYVAFNTFSRMSVLPLPAGKPFLLNCSIRLFACD